MNHQVLSLTLLLLIGFAYADLIEPISVEEWNKIQNCKEIQKDGTEKKINSDEVFELSDSHSHGCPVGILVGQLHSTKVSLTYYLDKIMQPTCIFKRQDSTIKCKLNN